MRKIALISWLMLSGVPVVLAENATRSAAAYELEEIVVTALRRAESAFALFYMIAVQGMRRLPVCRPMRRIPACRAT